MAWFIRKLLNPKDRESQPANYSKVTVKYFDDKKSASNYIKYKCNHEKFMLIELTEYVTKKNGTKQRENLLSTSKNTHDVIGEEYNNIIVIFDEYITYDEEIANLKSNYEKSSEYRYYPYDELNCYFEALTRVKDKLEIIIINNPKFYKNVLEILNWWKDSGNKVNKELKEENERLKEEIRKMKSKVNKI